MRPLPHWRIIQRDPHGRIHCVVATPHTHIVPSVLCGELSGLVILDGDGPKVLPSLGVHYRSKSGATGILSLSSTRLRSATTYGITCIPLCVHPRGHHC